MGACRRWEGCELPPPPRADHGRPEAPSPVAAHASPCPNPSSRGRLRTVSGVEARTAPVAWVGVACVAAFSAVISAVAADARWLAALGTRDHRARGYPRWRAVRERADAWLAECPGTRRAGVRSARLACGSARAAGRAGRGRHHRVLPRRTRRAPARRRGRLDRVRADHADPGRVRGDRRGPCAAVLARAVPRARRRAARRGAPAVPSHLARPAAARPLVEPARCGPDGSRRRGRVPAARPCAP